MAKFLYAAHLPCLQRSVNLQELSFKTYKELVKLIHNDDSLCITNALENIIDTALEKKIDNITFLDKLIILLTIRAVCIYPDLELTITNPDSKQNYNLKFNINDIVDKINKLDVFLKYNNVTKSYNNLKITYGIPSRLYYESTEQAVNSAIKKIRLNDTDVTNYKNDIYSALPAYVYHDAQKHIESIEKEISEITLLSISLYNQDEKIEMIPSFFNNSILDFIKLCYKKDLNSLYETEYFLTSKIKMPYEIVANSTFAELMIYFGFYNEERQAAERENNKGINNPLTPQLK